MKKPRKPCVECGGVLTGLRTRFCQNSCARLFEEKRRKTRYDLVRIHIPNKICVICEEEYKPRTTRQLTCSRNCGITLSNNNRLKKGDKFWVGKGRGKFGRGRIKKEVITQEEVEGVSMISKSKFKDEIQEFLNSGGKVVKLSPQIAKSTPSIGVALKLGGWSTDQLQGFGVEIDLMEETNLDLGGLRDL
jgi:predicted nucleic acid-binding Zn ribbon protein